MTGTRRIILPRLLLSSLVAGWISCVTIPAADANDKAERVTVLEENDSLYFNSDKHYTQGLRFSYLGPALDPQSEWDTPFDFLAGIPTVFTPSRVGEHRQRRYAVFVGQSIFTPKDLRRSPPDPTDRPYAGWLYGGISLLQEADQHVLENVELDIGIVGPAALGQPVQNDWHQLIGARTARGWGSQIHDEPGLMLTYERAWRERIWGRDSGIDVIPGAGATVGNVFTYGQVGALLRIGTGLAVDYGPVRIRPALSGTDFFASGRARDKSGYYVFAGVQARIVGRNLFLDGNSFQSSPGVDKKPLVADFQAGFSLFWSDAARLDFSVVERTEEFKGQRHFDPIGTASFAFSW
jgi:hypothetical protein